MTDNRIGPTTAAVHAPPATPRDEFVRRTLVAVGVVALAAALAAAFVLASDVFFLFFASLLLAILLRTAGDALARRTGLGRSWALAAVLLAAAAVVAAGAYFAGSMAVRQVSQLASDLPTSVDQARASLQRTQWGQEVLRHAPSARDALPGGASGAASWVARFFSTTLGVAGNLLVLTFLAIYLAAASEKYLRGAVALVPPARRGRAEEVLRTIGSQLRWWLLGRLVAMAAVGAITGAGLWAAGVPQFLVLGLVAGLLTAVPFVGPILAAVPGLLLALAQGPTTALWAVAVYALAQAVENYVVTPLVQQRAADLPPVVAIGAITLAGALFGVLGLIVASPLAVAVLAAVRMLYVEDVLGDDST